jgi:hypothetical protein
MTRINVALFLSLSLLAACGKKADDKAAPAGQPAPATKAGEPAAVPAPTPEPAAEAAAAPVKSTVKDVFVEFTKPDTDGMALLDKYKGGVTLTTKVAVKGHEETGKPVLWADIDGKAHASLDYTDVETSKKIKDGEEVTVTCKVGGAMDNMMMLIDCAPAK